MRRSWDTDPGTAPAGSISNSELADMPAGTQKGRPTGAGTGAPQDLTALQQLVNWSAANAVSDDGNSGAADTIDFSAGPVHKSTLTAACTYTFTAPTNPGVVTLRVVQDATGGRAITFPGTVVGTPVYSRAASAETTLTFFYDGTSYHYLVTTVAPTTAISWQQQGSFPSRSTYARLEVVEHFLGTTFDAVAADVSGAAAAVSSGTPTAARVGIINVSTGTDTTGRAGVFSGATSVRFGAGRHRLRWDVGVPVASDGTNTFTVRIGFLDDATGDGTDGVFFRYTNGVNGGEWEAVTRSNGTETATDTNTVLTTTGNPTFEIEVSANGAAATFYINGTLVATNATNIPTSSGRETGLGAGIIKSAGTTAREIRIDLMAYSFEPTTVL